MIFSIRPEVVLAVGLCALVTVVPRILPFAYMHKIPISSGLIAWLRMLPPSILAALFLPELLLAENDLRAIPDIGADLAASLVVIALAFVRPNNLMLSVLGGIATYAVLKQFF